jgi:hypothetical protein
LVVFRDALYLSGCLLAVRIKTVKAGQGMSKNRATTGRNP